MTRLFAVGLLAQSAGLLARFLFGVSMSDPVTLSGAAILLLLVIGAASAIPARRAARIDPIQAMRSE